VRYAGLWRHRPEDAPEGGPYNTSGSETVYILRGRSSSRSLAAKRSPPSKGLSVVPGRLLGDLEDRRAVREFFVVTS
jgi:hypothetical protein